MIVRLEIQNRNWIFNLKEGKAISIPVRRENSVGAFGIPAAVYSDYVDGSFRGNTSKGGPCNLETVSFTAHGNGTHTECIGHISSEKYLVNDCIKDDFMSALLISSETMRIADDTVLNLSHLDNHDLSGIDALIIRTMPNSTEKLSRDYTNGNAAYILPKDMKKIKEAGIKHLLVDMPSVDKEKDNGVLAAHHVFWEYPDRPRIDASISEFIYVEDSIADGLYMLKLNIGNFESDAAPSRPVIYPLKPEI